MRLKILISLALSMTNMDEYWLAIFNAYKIETQRLKYLKSKQYLNKCVANEDNELKM